MTKRPPRSLPILPGEGPLRRDLASALSPLVRIEAHQVASDASIAPDPARLAEGWERRFVGEGERAEEMIQLYGELGFEVVADPVRPSELHGECEACRIVAVRRFVTIYTRRPQRP